MDDVLKPNEKMLSTLAAELGLMSLVTFPEPMKETLEDAGKPAPKGATLT